MSDRKALKVDTAHVGTNHHPELLTPGGLDQLTENDHTDDEKPALAAGLVLHKHVHETPINVTISERVVTVLPNGTTTTQRVNFLAGHSDGHMKCDDGEMINMVSCSAMEDFQEEFQISREQDIQPHEQHAMNLRRYLLHVYKDGRFNHTPSVLKSFAERIASLCDYVKDILDQEPRMLKLKSPIYVLGDIHGNFEDLNYFLDQLVLFGDFEFCPYNVLFLGDYVDRGIWSVECTAMLLALKVMAPEKCFLLRGNHEFPEVNGDIARYGKGSFAAQCVDLFGEKMGNAVWRKCNFAFKYMPLAATIDGKIFCTHGGIPRVVGDKDNRMDMLNSPQFPRFASTSCIRDDSDPLRLLLTDLMWSDPIEGENVSTDSWGFGSSTRGPLLSGFSNKAVEEFFKANNFELMIRAHEHKRVGLRLSNHRRVLTVFSSSAYCGTSFAGGLLYIDQNTIRIVTKEVTEASKLAYEHYDASG